MGKGKHKGKKHKTDSQKRNQFIRTVKKTGRWRGKVKTLSDLE